MPPAETAYLFRHALLRDAAYQLQLPGDRGRLHGLAATSLEALNSGPGGIRKLDAAAAEIAGHLRLARAVQDSPDLMMRERGFTLRGALFAESRERNSEALPLWIRWVEVCEAGQRPRALLRAGISAGNLGKTDLAATLFRQAQAEGRAARDPLLLGRVSLHWGSLWWKLGKMTEARAELVSARRLLEQAGDRADLADVMGSLAIVCEQTGDMPEAEFLYARALEIQRELGHRPAQGRTMSNLAGLYGQTDRAALAEQTYVDALKIHREAGDRRFEGVTLGNLASLLQSLDRLEEAETACGEALAIHREVGNRPGEGSTLKNLADMRLQSGRLAEAEVGFGQALVVLSDCQNRRGEGLAHAALAIVYQLTGRLAPAAQTFERALAMLREVKYRRGEGELLGNYGNCLLAQGQTECAQDRWREGAAILSGLGDRRSLDRLLADMRESCLKAGLAPPEVLPETDASR